MRQKTDFFSGITHTGKVRDNNEDAFIVERILEDRYILACVIDGVGGYEGGEVAARIAGDSILNHLQKPSEDLFLAIREAVVIANEKIYAEKISSDRNTRMACVLTLAVIDLTYNQFYYAHVGDTRLYLLRDYTLVKITRDDSFVGFLEDSKRLSEEDAMKHPKRNEINKALGFDPNIGLISDYIETGISPFLPGDILLLCSDGLTDMIDSKTITGILTSRQKIPEKAKALIDAANNAGGKDNITVVLLHNTNKRAVLEATKPPVVKKNELQIENGDPETLENGPQFRKRKGGYGLTVVLLVLCLGLLGALLWQISKNKKEKPLQPVIVEKQKNDAELKLQQNIKDSSFVTMNDSIYGEFILISDTILIDRDSIHINGNNQVLQSDIKTKSAAFIIAPSSRFVLFENMTFKNFEKAIIIQNKNVQLKNVRFLDCEVSLEHYYRFPQNNSVSGSIIDTVLFKTDSVAN
jgi:serine/threonine protein phosphatase PrpC